MTDVREGNETGKPLKVFKAHLPLSVLLLFTGAHMALGHPGLVSRSRAAVGTGPGGRGQLNAARMAVRLRSGTELTQKAPLLQTCSPPQMSLYMEGGTRLIKPLWEAAWQYLVKVKVGIPLPSGLCILVQRNLPAGPHAHTQGRSWQCAHHTHTGQESG